MPVETRQSGDIRPQVDRILFNAVGVQASDIHFEPLASGYEIRYRIDGLLEKRESVDSAAGRAIINRLMIMARLLTYHLDVPQEGRLITEIPDHGPLELRLSVIPTRHGLRAVLRLPAELLEPAGLLHGLHALNLPANVVRQLELFTLQESGLLAVTGPAGSGKTTTVYAVLAHIAEQCPGQSIVSLEDPVERDLPGVTQIEITPFGQMDYARAMRSLLRQDPQVLALGEIRDAATASLAMQAALTGHRLICTMHAGSPAAALRRWCEMGIEPHQISSAVGGILTQRLLRRRTPNPSAEDNRSQDGGRQVYHGRIPVAEFAVMDEPLRQALLAHGDAGALDAAIRKQKHYVPLRQAAMEYVHNGRTDLAEVDRVLGPNSADLKT